MKLSPINIFSGKAALPKPLSRFQTNDIVSPYKINSIYDKGINFTGYIAANPQRSVVFDDTTPYNPYYFRLPEVEKEDGSKFQFLPDESQVACAKEILDGKSVVYVAPTGTGKTAVAHFATTKNLEEGKRTIITVPLIALANDKFQEFSKIYGPQNVGVLTGERKFNPNAPILIETTEILYNQSNQFPKTAKNIGTIIFDEAHYITDEQRGNTWENSIIEAIPNDIQILCLSATVGNADKLTSWIQNLNPSHEVSKIEIAPKERYVPLIYTLFQSDTMGYDARFTPVKDAIINLNDIQAEKSEKQKRALNTLYKAQNDISDKYYYASSEDIEKMAQDIKDKALKSQDAYEFKNISSFENFLQKSYPALNKTQIEEVSRLLTDESTSQIKMIHQPHQEDNYPFLIDCLEHENMLPALIFKLSRGACDDIVRDLKDFGYDLTTEEEKEQIKTIIERYKKDKIYLGTKFDEELLLRGYASHHAGKLPQYKKLVEELFSKKLLKVITATSTLSAGINMPAKTVVITDVEYKKFNPETQEVEYTPLGVNEFHQMSGRAGRRGIDDVGYVVIYNLHTPSRGFKDKNDTEGKPDQLMLAYELLGSKADDLRSQFRPDPYLMAKYYSENTTNDNLLTTVDNSFKAYLAKDHDKEVKSLIKKFENFSQVLLKQGYLIKNNQKEMVLTDKGQILLHSQGANPLMLSGLIYDEKLKDITPVGLVQIAGYIAGADEQEETKEMAELIGKKLAEFLKKEENAKDLEKQFFQTRAIYENREQKILKALKESKVPAKDISISDNFSGYTAFLWAYLNQKDPNHSILNFERIMNSALSSVSKDEPAAGEFNRKASEGLITKNLAQCASVLKQTRRICEFAINHPEQYPNTEYYKKLEQKAVSALGLIKYEPVFDKEIK